MIRKPWSVVPNDAESSRFVVERRGSALSDAGYPGEGPGITTESQGLERTHSGSVMRPPSCASRTVAKTGSERTVGSASWRAGDMSGTLGLDHRPSAASPHALAYIAPGLGALQGNVRVRGMPAFMALAFRWADPTWTGRMESS